MFEKEAEEYTIENVCSTCYFEKPCENKCEAFGCADSKTYVLKAFKDGAEFGYKANEWHYPSKGELPKDEFIDEYTHPRLFSVYKQFYCLYLGDDCVIGKYIRGFFCTVEGKYSLNEVAAWKKIVLPELSIKKEIRGN